MAKILGDDLKNIISDLNEQGDSFWDALEGFEDIRDPFEDEEPRPVRPCAGCSRCRPDWFDDNELDLEDPFGNDPAVD